MAETDTADSTPTGETSPAETKPKRVLLIQAHPDDAEFMCAGTVARWISEGAEVHYASLTSGDKGSDDPAMTGPELASMREREQRAACDVLGVKSITFLGYPDAMLVPDLAMRLVLTRLMRQIRPDVLLCQDPTMRWGGQGYINHPDHIAAGEASLAAVFPSVRDRLTFPELLNEGLEPHKVNEVYIYGTNSADRWIDITGSIDTKIAALKAHASQIGEWDPTDMMKSWARETANRHPARPDGFGEFAEAFKYVKLD
ncbi:MAG TPA: PIG-L deacetylase family protein [Thermomicrobiales bacterium]|nr:PIG-L deacetylase family protein [Thermomicrobiales bacterium]